MSPLKIDLCLHYYSRFDDHEWVSGNAPIKEETLRDLIDMGLITKIRPEGISWEASFYGTPKLSAYIRLLCDTPLPEQKWVDPRFAK